MNVKAILIIVTIPAMLALAHDVYLFAENYYLHSQNPKIDARPFMFTDLGKAWQLADKRFGTDSYRSAAKSLIEAGWWEPVNMLLAQKTILVGLGFAGIFYALFGFLRIFHLPPFSESVKSKIGLVQKGQKGGFKYNRK